MYSGGVLHVLHRKAHDIKEPCGVSTLSTRSKELSPSSSYWRTNKNPLQSKQVPGPHADAVSLRPAHALLSFIFKNPPPSPHDRPWSMRTTDARIASDPSRERSSQTRPRDSRRENSSPRDESCNASEPSWPPARPPSSANTLAEHVRGPGRLKSFAPVSQSCATVPGSGLSTTPRPCTSVCLGVWVITAARPYPMATKVAHSAPPKSWALRATWGC